MTDRELMQEAWETLNLVMAPFPVDDQRCLRVARMLEKRLKQLEVQSTHSDDCWLWHHECAIAKIERLAQPEQEPVAWMFTDVEGTEFFEEREDWEGKWTPLYTTPPAAPDLLETLKRIVDEPNNTMSDGKALKEIIRIARLAITKATGEKT